jgi:hypothetical protein
MAYFMECLLLRRLVLCQRYLDVPALGKSANVPIDLDVKVQGVLGADGGGDGIEAADWHVEDDGFANRIRVQR